MARLNIFLQPHKSGRGGMNALRLLLARDCAGHTHFGRDELMVFGCCAPAKSRRFEIDSMSDAFWLMTRDQ